ncbi:TatD family hydrolase [Propionivibrio sp.]|uniref:TatD family hydrolase n=1 Tax=Propionivibrio sp. TaxID=2212460 RepID=UPI003BF21A78
MLIDTHCHLDAHEFDADRDAVVLAARESGVSAMLIPAVETGNFSAVRDCCTRYPGCFPAYGMHPLYVERASEADLVMLGEWLEKELIGASHPVAVGEIGLDHYVPGFDAARQEHFFVEQLKIARDFDLPVLLHVRRAVDQVLKCLRRISVRGGIAHAFNGSRQQADEFIRLGFKLGFGGAMTYPGSTRIRQLAATLPIDSIVLETDAPDMAPYWLAGQRNRPIELFRIARTLSELQGLSMAEVQATTSANAVELLHLPLPVLRT